MSLPRNTLRYISTELAAEWRGETWVGTGGLDRDDDLADVRARHDALLGMLISERVKAEVDRSGGPRAVSGEQLDDLRKRVAAEVWDAITVPEHVDDYVDAMRAVGRQR